MSTANLVPETWELTGDDAKETLDHTGRRPCSRRVRTAASIRRLQPRPIDGLPGGRCVFVQGVIGAVGIASTLGSGGSATRS